MIRIYIVSVIAWRMAFSSFGFVSGTENPDGKLFIIGGGDKPAEMMNELVTLSAIGKDDYVFVLPMASSKPDSAIIWAKESFAGTKAYHITGYNFRKGEVPPAGKLDSLRKARLVYISGGDQSRFMEAVRNTPVMEAVLYAWSKGAVISGTSAGAAVMSRKMITGNQIKHTEEDAGFRSIESDNIETTEGLGLLPDVIVDQHFIKRQRLNRLISVAIENPGNLCVGIDESTAIIVEGDKATVTGKSQVIVIKNPSTGKKVQNGLLGKEELELSVYLPGETFMLR